MAGAAAAVTVEEVRKAQRASGPATVLAIGTATPANCVHQADYPDYYFRVTKSEHLTDLKEKINRICAYICYTNLSSYQFNFLIIKLLCSHTCMLAKCSCQVDVIVSIIMYTS